MKCAKLVTGFARFDLLLEDARFLAAGRARSARPDQLGKVATILIPQDKSVQSRQLPSARRCAKLHAVRLDDLPLGQKTLGQNGFLQLHQTMRILHVIGQDRARGLTITGPQGGDKARLIIQPARP